MSKYRLEIDHVDHEGTETTYIVQCRSMTRKQLNKARAEAETGENDDAIFEQAIARVSIEGGDHEVDIDDLPVEVTTRILEEHPSFRVPDQTRANRRRR